MRALPALFKHEAFQSNDAFGPLRCIACEWAEDSTKERGRLLTGKFSHWCDDWDGLTIDETCDEWPCACSSNLQRMMEEK